MITAALAARRARLTICAACLLCIFAGCKRAAPNPPAATGVAATAHAPAATAAEPALRDYVLRPDLLEEQPPPPQLRILSAAPNVTEICCALGLRSSLVGRTRYCVYPPDVAALPSIGALTDVSTETVISLKPDLILIAGSSRELAERFSRLEIRLESLADTSLDDLFVAITRVGELTGRPRTAAALVGNLRAQLAAVAAAHRHDPPRRYLLVTGLLADPPAPPFVAGPGSFYSGLLQRVGHRNVMPDDSRAFGSASLEYLIAADPEVIIELDPDGQSRPGGNAAALRTWARVGDLAAVRNRRICVLTGPQHYLIGPRIAETFREMLDCLAIAPSD